MVLLVWRSFCATSFGNYWQVPRARLLDVHYTNDFEKPWSFPMPLFLGIERNIFRYPFSCNDTQKQAAFTWTSLGLLGFLKRAFPLFLETNAKVRNLIGSRIKLEFFRRNLPPDLITNDPWNVQLVNLLKTSIRSSFIWKIEGQGNEQRKGADGERFIFPKTARAATPDLD